MNHSHKSRSEIKREAIVEAAKRAFQEDGVQSTSMDRLAEIAGVSKRTVYNHFATKSDLVMHLLAEMWQETMVRSPIIYQCGQAIVPQLEQLIRAQITLCSSQQYIELARVALGHFFYHPQQLKQEVERLASQETIVQRFVKDAVNDNALVIDDPAYAIEQLNDMIKGRCFWPQVLKIQPQPDEQEVNFIAAQTAATFLARYSVSC